MVREQLEARGITDCGVLAAMGSVPRHLFVQEALRAQGEELEEQAGGLSPFLNAFFSGRKLTMEEALELKDLIDQHTWED